MQDNEPLKCAPSGLIALNNPDLVLFVGEALVGNDAVDQLTKFAQRLADLASGPTPHTIDGILLTKFDTIDDKVGLSSSAHLAVSQLPEHAVQLRCWAVYMPVRGRLTATNLYEINGQLECKKDEPRNSSTTVGLHDACLLQSSSLASAVNLLACQMHMCLHMRYAPSMMDSHASSHLALQAHLASWSWDALAMCLQVGAALSMVYTSGAPIMFVGCGQTYPDLTRLNVKSVVRSLLK